MIFHAHVSSYSQQAELSLSLSIRDRSVTNICDIEWRSCAWSFDNCWWSICNVVILRWRLDLYPSCYSSRWATSQAHVTSSGISVAALQQIGECASHVWWSELQMSTHLKFMCCMINCACTVWLTPGSITRLSMSRIVLVKPCAWLTHLAQGNKLWRIDHPDQWATFREKEDIY